MDLAKKNRSTQRIELKTTPDEEKNDVSKLKPGMDSPVELVDKATI